VKTILALCLLLAVAGCASFEGRGLVPGQSTATDVERVMGSPAETRKMPNGETWYYYPRQPFGRQVFVARTAPDGKLIGVEPRLTEENVKKIVPNQTRAEEVRELFGPPYEVMRVPRMEREMWTWYMRRFGDPGIPAQLVIQLSPDGVVREVYLLDDSDRERNIVPGLR
jgi:hypothetical protein